MSQQEWFNLYVIIIVSIIGQSILAWEFGRKDFVGIAKAGPNKRLIFAFVLFFVQILWQRVAGLESPINSWKNLWPLLIVVSVFFVARASRNRHS